MPKADIATREPIERPLQVAAGETDQVGTAAAALLAWWNTNSRRDFDLADLWAVCGHRPRQASYGRLYRDASALPSRPRPGPQVEQMAALGWPQLAWTGDA